MAADNDKPSNPKPTPPGQPDLPFATSEEQAKFFNILVRLKDGSLKPEEAHIPILQLFDTSLGAWVRALRRSHPAIAARIAIGMKQDLDEVAQHGGVASNAASDVPSPGKDARSGPRLGSKLVNILDRERLLIEALLRHKEPQTLADLHKVVGPQIKVAALTANLDRLETDGFIDRPRKGYYAMNDSSQNYLDALKAEIAARGSGKR